MPSAYPRELLDRAHAHCVRNRSEIERSGTCGCFYCAETFPPAAVDDGYDEDAGEKASDPAPPDATAFCPRCGIDSVIGDASGFAVATSAFLRAMHDRWFERA